MLRIVQGGGAPDAPLSPYLEDQSRQLCLDYSVPRPKLDALVQEVRRQECAEVIAQLIDDIPAALKAMETERHDQLCGRLALPPDVPPIASPLPRRPWRRRVRRVLGLPG